MVTASAVGAPGRITQWTWSPVIQGGRPALTLRCIAHDYLPIQGSSTPSEHAFSGGGITGTAHRNRLSPKLFLAIQILKSAYRNGYATAANKVSLHVDVHIAALDAMDDKSEDEAE